jgi:hypothetical protein
VGGIGQRQAGTPGCSSTNHNWVYAIGGNVSNSVSVTRYAKTDSGHLGDAGGVFALLVNKV